MSPPNPRLRGSWHPQTGPGSCRAMRRRLPVFGLIACASDAACDPRPASALPKWRDRRCPLVRKPFWPPLPRSSCPNRIRKRLPNPFRRAADVRAAWSVGTAPRSCPDPVAATGLKWTLESTWKRKMRWGRRCSRRDCLSKESGPRRSVCKPVLTPCRATRQTMGSRLESSRRTSRGTGELSGSGIGWAQRKTRNLFGICYPKTYQTFVARVKKRV